MYINDSIAQAYILGEDMRCYEKEWFFSGSTVDVDRGKIFSHCHRMIMPPGMK